MRTDIKDLIAYAKSYGFDPYPNKPVRVPLWITGLIALCVGITLFIPVAYMLDKETNTPWPSAIRIMSTDEWQSMQIRELMRLIHEQDGVIIIGDWGKMHGIEVSHRVVEKQEQDPYTWSGTYSNTTGMSVMMTEVQN